MKVKCAAQMAAMAGMAAVLGLAGCMGAPAPDRGSQVGSAQSEPAEKTVEQKAAELYRGVLADPMAYFGHLEEQGMAEGVSFEYALVEATGDKVPELVVRASGAPDLWNGMAEVMPFTVSDDGSELVVPSVWLNEGVAGSGGFRGSVSASACGDGLLVSEMSSGSGEGTVRRYTWDDPARPQRIVCDTQVGSDSTVVQLVESELAPIEWEGYVPGETDLDELEDLAALEAGAWVPAQGLIERDPADAARELGLIVLTGTVHELDDQGIADLQGVENPNPGSSSFGMSAVLQLDGPTTVTARNGDGMGSSEGEAKFVALDREASELDWGGYQGRHVTVAIDPTLMWWPSDTSLPLGEPYVTRGGVAVLAVGE